MKKIICFLVFTAFLLPVGILFAQDKPQADIPKEILEKPFLYEVAKYLYRWYLDEIDIENIFAKENFTFKIHKLNPKLDPDDKSQYVEILIPDLKLCVTLKKSDYMIEELNVEVKSKGFKINNVSRYDKEFVIPADCTDVNINQKEMRDYLFKTRKNTEFPSPELYARIKAAFRKEFDEEVRKKVPEAAFKKDWVTFAAPLSPVSNEFWAFWENGKLLVRCSSDIELTDPAVWEHENLSFKIYDAYNQMVVSLGEAEGDNSFMTRDQIGRALYNCVVLGERIIVRQNAEEEKK